LPPQASCETQAPIRVELLPCLLCADYLAKHRDAYSSAGIDIADCIQDDIRALQIAGETQQLRENCALVGGGGVVFYFHVHGGDGFVELRLIQQRLNRCRIHTGRSGLGCGARRRQQGG
jgi:hypothetical protein